MKKGFIQILVIAGILLGTVLIGGVSYYAGHKNSEKTKDISELNSKSNDNAEIEDKQNNQKENETTVKQEDEKELQETNNYSQILSGAYKNYADRIDISIDAVTKISNASKEAMFSIENLIKKSAEIKNSYEEKGEEAPYWMNIFLSAYEKDLEYFKGSYGFYQTNIALLNESKNKFIYLSNSVLEKETTKEFAIKEIEFMNSKNYISEVLDAVRKIYNLDINYIQKAQADYEKAFDYLEGETSDSKPSYLNEIPTYISYPAITIPMIEITNTYCNVYGDSISCDSYTY